MNKYVLLVFGLLTCNLLVAQSIAINGVIVIKDASPESSKVVISKNGKKIDEQVLSKKGHFDLKLSFDADYKLTFEKAGYIPKIISVNTEIPEEILESNPNFPPIKLTITLFPHVENVDLSIFSQPIAILAYNDEIDDFIFDEEYSKIMKDRIAQTEQKIRQAILSQGSAALKLEQKFQDLLTKGQRSFERKEWSQAITHWSQALEMKPENNDIKQKIELARKEMEVEASHLAVKKQNEEAYQLLIASADDLFKLKKYREAKDKYNDAIQLDNQNQYPVNQIKQINDILTNLAKQQADLNKQKEANNDAYKKAITIANDAFTNEDYTKAISSYRNALNIKMNETYPKEMIAKAEQAIATKNKQNAAEVERKRIEEERINGLKDEYDQLITEADKAFRSENYGLAKLRYTEADNLNLGEEYPKKQLLAIGDIINSAQYKIKLAEYNKNKTLAEKSKQQKNYAGAKMYYQKALSILSIHKVEIEQQIIDIDKLIQEVQLAEADKAYNEHIDKADKANNEKAYAVARFYYKKALEIKVADKYATDKLKELEKQIKERQSKEAQL